MVSKIKYTCFTERIPMPEPQFPVVPQGVEGEIPVAKTEEVESETNKTNQSASPQGRKKKQSVTPKQEDHIDGKMLLVLMTRISPFSDFGSFH